MEVTLTAYPSLLDSYNGPDAGEPFAAAERARPPMDDAHLRGALRRQAVERAVPPEPRQGSDGTVGRVRSADPDWLRPRPRARPGRGRERWRADRPRGRHAHDAVRE